MVCRANRRNTSPSGRVRRSEGERSGAQDSIPAGAFPAMPQAWIVWSILRRSGATGIFQHSKRRKRSGNYHGDQEIGTSRPLVFFRGRMPLVGNPENRVERDRPRCFSARGGSLSSETAPPANPPLFRERLGRRYRISFGPESPGTPVSSCPHPDPAGRESLPSSAKALNASVVLGRLSAHVVPIAPLALPASFGSLPAASREFGSEVSDGVFGPRHSLRQVIRRGGSRSQFSSLSTIRFAARMSWQALQPALGSERRRVLP